MRRWQAAPRRHTRTSRGHRCRTHSSSSTPTPTTKRSPPAARWRAPRAKVTAWCSSPRREASSASTRPMRSRPASSSSTGGSPSCTRPPTILGVDRVEFLGYLDSGMAGEPTNDAPGSFASADIDEAAEPARAHPRRRARRRADGLRRERQLRPSRSHPGAPRRRARRPSSQAPAGSTKRRRTATTSSG